MAGVTISAGKRLEAVAVFLMLALTACSTSGHPKASPMPAGGPASPSDPAGRETAPPHISASSFLLREYYGHARGFHIDQAGYGLIEWRAAHKCSEAPPPTPCYGDDPNRPGGVAPIFIRSVTGTVASGFVLSTTESDVFDVGAVTLRWDRRTDVLTVADRHGSQFTFCGPQNPGTCGL